MRTKAKIVLAIFLILCLAIYVPAVMAEDDSTDPSNSAPIENPAPNDDGQGNDDQVQPGESNDDEGQPGEGNGDEGQPGEENTEEGQPDESNGDKGQPGEDNGDEGQPGEENTEEGQPGESNGDESQPGEDNGDEGQPGEENTEEGQPGESNGDEGQPGEDPGSADQNGDGVIDGIELKNPPLEMVNHVVIETPEPELAVSLVFDEDTYAPGEIAYGTLVIKNDGPVPLSNITIEGYFPVERFSEDQDEFMYGGGLLENSIASLAVGEAKALPVFYWIPHFAPEGQLDLDITVTVYYQGGSLNITPSGAEPGQEPGDEPSQEPGDVPGQEPGDEPNVTFGIQSLSETPADNQIFNGQYSITINVILNIAGEPNWFIECGPAPLE